MYDTDVFLLKLFANVAAQSREDNEHSPSSSLVNAVPLMNARAVA
jgi:hypothetical protein